MHLKNRRSLYQWIDFCDFTIQSDIYIFTATTTNLEKKMSVLTVATEVIVI